MSQDAKKRTREEESSSASESDAKKQKQSLGEEHTFDPSKQHKFISWNVNGMKAMYGKDNGKHFKDMVEKEQPSIICLQETKLQNKDSFTQPFAKVLQGYTATFNCCSAKNGYSGTAVYVRDDLKNATVTKDMGIGKHDKEGRLICVELEDYFLVNTYVPNSGQKLERLAYRTKEWDSDMLAYLKKLQETKPVVWTGDLNVAFLDIDVHDPKKNKRTAGFTDEERAEFRKVINDEKFVDSFRMFHENEKNQYTYWGYRFNMREKDKGWRLDYFIVSDKAKSNIVDSYILKQVHGSDHCPIGILLNKQNSDTK